MSATAPVLVVGAGPTGLLLAGELHRRGVPCHLVDAEPEPLHWDRATVVHPRSLEMFESIGLLERFLEAGVEQRVARLHSDGQVLGEIDISTCGSRYGFNVGISEEVTESILTDHLQHHGGQVVRGARLVTLEDGPDGLLVGIDGHGSLEHASFEWVVGCDGLHSVVRRLCDIELMGHDIPEPWAVFDATATGWSEPFEANYCYLEATPVILTALPDQRWRVYLRPTSPDSDLVADAASTIRLYHPEVSLDDIANPTRFQCHTKVATSFRSGRVLLAGDAAHVCSPAEGHGMNSGLQDAFNLAWKLALVARGECGPDLLDSYEAERRPVAEMITRSGDATERSQTLADPAERRARDDALRAAFGDANARHQEVIAEAELDIDYGGSPIVVGDANAALAPGQRLPDTIPVRLAGGEDRYLHELTYHTGHTLVIVGGRSARDDELARLEAAARAAVDGALIDETVVLGTRPSDPGRARVDPAGADQLGIDGVTLLAVRPDGYIGLRADGDHLSALEAYVSVLTTGHD